MAAKAMVPGEAFPGIDRCSGAWPPPTRAVGPSYKGRGPSYKFIDGRAVAGAAHGRESDGSG